MLLRKAVEVIESHPPEDPLFLYLAYQAPHMNIQVLFQLKWTLVKTSTTRSLLQCTWMSTQGKEFTRKASRKTIRRSIELLL